MERGQRMRASASHNGDAEMDRRVNAMLARDARAFERMSSREDRAYQLIGELVRGGEEVFYINLLDRQGRPTGSTREGTRLELVRYLLRNRYV
jgi:hypothetical protein